MERDQFPYKSLAGSVLLAPGLFLLCGHLLFAAIHWVHFWGSPDSDGLGVLSSVMWASSIGEQQLLHLLLHSLWPLLLVVAGSVLLGGEPNPEAEERKAGAAEHAKNADQQAHQSIKARQQYPRRISAGGENAAAQPFFIPAVARARA